MSKGLKVWYLVKKYLEKEHHKIVKENIPLKTVEGLSLDIIEQELKALEIIKKYPNNRNSLANFRYMVGYWERNNVKVTKELLETYDFPFETDEYNLLKEVLL